MDDKVKVREREREASQRRRQWSGARSEVGFWFSLFVRAVECVTTVMTNPAAFVLSL